MQEKYEDAVWKYTFSEENNTSFSEPWYTIWKKAFNEFELEKKCSVRKCGSFVDSSFPFLGATPDGVLDKETLLEINFLKSKHYTLSCDK